jgi:hypothetical protein
MYLLDPIAPWLPSCFSTSVGFDCPVFNGSWPCTSGSIAHESIPFGDGSSQALLRHPEAAAYRCFLPDLTGFTGFRRVGPGSQHHRPRAVASRVRPQRRNSASLERIASTRHRYLPA